MRFLDPRHLEITFRVMLYAAELVVLLDKTSLTLVRKSRE
jgi:hypothetical protein